MCVKLTGVKFDENPQINPEKVLPKMDALVPRQIPMEVLGPEGKPCTKAKAGVCNF